MRSLHSARLDLAANTGGVRVVPVQAVRGTAWLIHKVEWMGVMGSSDGLGNVGLSHDLATSAPASTAELLDIDLWAGVGFFAEPKYPTFFPGGYMIAGPQLLVGYAATRVLDMTVFIYYETVRVSVQDWSWLRLNRSREQ